MTGRTPRWTSFTAQPQPSVLYVVAARFDLALAHLGRDELDAVGEHLGPRISTPEEYRSV